MYYPLRYYVCAFVVAFVLLSNVEYIKAIDNITINSMLNLFGILSEVSPNYQRLLVHGDEGVTSVILPAHIQILFLMFFPTIALTARTSMKIRLKVLLFGAITAGTFIILGFLNVVVFYGLDMLDAKVAFRASSVITALVGGALILETLLFSTITLPTRTKIKRVIKRNYTREYLYLVTALGLAFAIIYGIVNFLNFDVDSPFFDYVHLTLLLNMSHILFASFFISNLIYEVERPRRLRKTEAMDRAPFSISFLIPANNEERIVGRCIESIDRAAAKYGGKTEIIVVNDGSTDNTESVISEAMKNLKFADGKYYTIPNSGKGYACAYGLPKTTGEIIFRSDADSVMDENVLTLMMRHFKDPQVGSVCTWIFPLNMGERETTMTKIQNVLNANYRYNKRAQDVFDAIIVQPGCSTAFRRDVIINSGGWLDNIFGEDGEITNRVGRLGYRGIFEPSALVYTEHPSRLIGFMQQRARWSVAFYHSRNRNLRLLKEFRTPRSIVYMWNIVSHGIGFAKGMLWPYFAASFATGVLGLALADIPFFVLLKLAAIQLSITVIMLILYTYRLHKVGKTGDIIYFPFLRAVNLLLNLVVKPQVLEILLSWSTRWKKYSTESFKDLRREVRRNVDPLYPDGSVVTPPSSSAAQAAHPAPPPPPAAAETV
jgi:cellulose synthase/poly-beta-1,6-N-acetylglucosamine synthase-like glycosyltransferase